MILRRVIAHFRKQEWTAIGLDFLIVVVGVFVGLQVNNWNGAQSARYEYKMALERYAAEIDANLTDLREVEEKSLDRISIVRKGFDTLLTCEDSPENRRIVEAGVRRILGSDGIDIRMTSLRELTESPALLAQQSEAERKILNDMRFRIDFLLSEGVYAENLPTATNVERNPMLGVGERELDDWVIFSKDASLTPDLHGLVVAAPLDVACKDDALLKAFYIWEHWQNSVPDLARALHETLEESRKGLKI